MSLHICTYFMRFAGGSPIAATMEAVVAAVAVNMAVVAIVGFVAGVSAILADQSCCERWSCRISVCRWQRTGGSRSLSGRRWRFVGPRISFAASAL